MITDDQGSQILKKMDEQFKEMNGKMDEQFKELNGKMDIKFAQIDVRFEQIDVRFEKIDERLDKHDKRFEKNDTVLENITSMLVSHDHLLKTLPTREEFDAFKCENAEAHDRTAKAIEKIEQELRASNSAHERLQKQFDKHEVALVKHKLLLADPA